MLRNTLIEIIRELNDDVSSNPEYLRGQIELISNLLGYSDDGYHDRLQIITDAFPNAKLSERKAAL